VLVSSFCTLALTGSLEGPSAAETLPCKWVPYKQSENTLNMQDFMSIIGEDNSETLVALLADEAQYHMTSKFLDGQHGISPEHRHFLVSWMMTVLHMAPGRKFNLACHESPALWHAWQLAPKECAGAQAATYHNLGAFTSALAVNLLDRFLAAQRTNVSSTSGFPCCLCATLIVTHISGVT
jgi:hypothetical protein